MGWSLMCYIIYMYVRSDGAKLRTLFDSCMCRDAELSCYGIFQKLDLKYFSREVCIACMQSKRVRSWAPSDLTYNTSVTIPSTVVPWQDPRSKCSNPLLVLCLQISLSQPMAAESKQQEPTPIGTLILQYREVDKRVAGYDHSNDSHTPHSPLPTTRTVLLSNTGL